MAGPLAPHGGPPGVGDRLVLGATDDELADLWRIATLGKLPGHGIDDPSFLQPSRPMSAIGG